MIRWFLEWRKRRAIDKVLKRLMAMRTEDLKRELALRAGWYNEFKDKDE